MVRSFTDEPVAPDILDRILENALHAPSAGFSQGWAFVVLEGDDTELFWETCGDAIARRPGIRPAPVVIIPLAHEQAYLDRYSLPDKHPQDWHLDVGENWPTPYWDIDTGFAALLILLTVVDAGLGAVFFGIFHGERELLEKLGVPDGYKPIGAIALGHPDGKDRLSPSLKRGRRGVEEVVHRGRWRA